MNDSGSGRVVIKKAFPDDAETLSDIGKLTFAEAFGETNTKEDLENYLHESFNIDTIKAQLEGSNIFYIAEVDNEAVGYLKLNASAGVPEVEGLKALQLERIYVRRNQYRMGLGSILLNKAISVARDMKFDHLWLGVWQENKRAIDFYLKHNFKTIGTKLFKIGDNITKDFVMLLKI